MTRSKATRYFNNFWLFIAFSTIAALSVSCSQNRSAADEADPRLLMGSTFTGNGFLPLPNGEADPGKSAK